MIGSLRGVLSRKDPEGIVLEVAGVGYLVRVPLSTYYDLGSSGDEVALRVHTYVRDDAIELYGFRTGTEQRLFEALIGVSGIGPKLAVTILSGMEIDDLVSAISRGDAPRLSTIPGVGKKTSERMALELKDKVAEMAPGTAAPRGGVRDDVVSALLNLGYNRRAAEAALKKVQEPAEDLETLLRQTLRVLAK